MSDLEKLQKEIDAYKALTVEQRIAIVLHQGFQLIGVSLARRNIFLKLTGLLSLQGSIV
jgi:hypothetical protein